MPRLNDNIRGWRRVTSYSPCKYCSGLAGQIYGPETDTFRSHDRCSCSVEPVYASEERRGGRGRTVAQTRQALKERGVKAPAGILKQELEDLLDELEAGIEPAAARANAAAAVKLRKELADAGVTTIAGAPRGVLEDLAAALRRGVDPEQARQQALTQLTELRGMVADKLSDIVVALDSDISARAMTYWARQLRRLSEGADGPGFPARAVPELGVPLRPLVQALEAGDAQAARAALPDAVSGSKLEQLGAPNTVTTRSALGGDVEWIGAGRGDAVFVVRPGFSTTIEGRVVVVTKPAVQAATPEQIAALGARKAAKAAPAKKATAARSFDEAVSAARTGAAAENLPPVIVRIDASSGSDVTKWRAVEATGLEGPQSGLLTAATSRVRTSGLANPRLRGETARMREQREQLERFGVRKAPEQVAKREARADREIAALDRAMEQSKLPADAVVWRFGRPTGVTLPDGSAVGLEWTDLGFVGTSARRNVAESFAAGDRTLMRILAPEGTPAIGIQGGGEAEVLLSRGLRFRVVGETRTPSGARVLDVEIIPAAPAKKAAAAADSTSLIPSAEELGRTIRARFPEATPAEVAAKVRLARVTDARAMWRLFAEVDELTTNGASADVLKHRIRTVAKQGNVPDATRDALLSAVDSGDAASLARRLADQAGIVSDARAGAIVSYDPAAHRVVGPAIPAGTPVRVMRPGGRWDPGDGLIGLEKADVKAAPVKATKAAPAKKATAAAKAAPKKAPAPKAPPAADRMTAPALRRELAERGVSEDLAADLPKPALENFVRRLREGVNPTEEAGRVRLAVVERQRALADALAEASQLLDNGATAELLGRRAAQRLARVEELLGGWLQDAPLRSLVRAMQGGNPAAIRRAITAAEKRGLTRLGGKAGDTLRYDRKAMSPIAGEKIPDGATVRVVRPGYEVTIGGQRVTLMRPVVEVVDESTSPAAIRQAYDARVRELRAAVDAESSATVRQLGGGMQADVDLLTLPDGRQIVRKIYGSKVRNLHTAADAKDLADREELGALVAEAFGVRAPAILRPGRAGRLYQEFVEGQSGADLVPWGQGVPADIAGTESWRRMRLFDVIAGNGDRNEGNWLLASSGDVVAIDHGALFLRAGLGPGELEDVAQGFSAADVAAIRVRLDALRGDFARMRRLDLYRVMMRNLSELEAMVTP